MNEKVVESSMQIILAAGDARVACKKALDALTIADMEQTEKYMKEAGEKITEAHRVQTDAIQAETRGEAAEYSLLFAHAQDTLMTIYSEINIAKQLVKLMEGVNARLDALEQR